jgi:hypothetical protein
MGQREVEKGEGEAGSQSANSNVPHRAFDFGRRRRALFVCLSGRRRERPRACVRAWRGSGVNILACSGWRVGRTYVRGARAAGRRRGVDAAAQHRSVGSGECGVWARARGMRGIRRFGCTNQYRLRLTYSVPSISP